MTKMTDKDFFEGEGVEMSELCIISEDIGNGMIKVVASCGKAYYETIEK